MKRCFLGWFWTLLVVAPTLVRGQGAMFTYQGRLSDAGRPANGSYDLQFALTDAALEGNYVGTTLTRAPVEVNDGLFTVMLDFGTGVFDGTPRWLEIGVRTNGSADAYLVLNPRQPITPAPYALFAVTAGVANSSTGTDAPVYNGLALAGLTNVVLYATNNSVIRSIADTNSIYVSGAGVSDANGIYTLLYDTPTPVYGNAQGLKLASTPDDLDYAWRITDPAGTVLYGCWSADFSVGYAWQTIGGVAPTPRWVSYGTNNVTNTIMQLGVAGGTIPGPLLGNDLYVNVAIGNDIFAQRGRPDLPFATVEAALLAATNNDVVHVAPGIYNETFNLTLPPGVKLIGAGKRVTCIYGAEAGFANFDLSTSNVLSDFSTDFIISLGGYAFTSPAYGGSTNALLENIEAYGHSDVVFGTRWQGFRAVNCDFTSWADCFADGQTEDIGTNAVAELSNCRLAAGWHVLANYGRSQIRVFGGSIEATSTDSSACVFALDTGKAGASIELNAVSLRCPPAGAHGRSYAIENESSGHCAITARGMLLKGADVSGDVTYEGFGLTTNLPVLGLGMRTNLLCFTNGILMDIR
jgi:hypothetical protein